MSATPSDDPTASTAFVDLALREALLKVLRELGYETPSPIQAATIPHLLEGRDLLGQAQTGTGKTAAFALPILQRLDLSKTKPQALVLAPTRELAIQVAEAFQRYATHLQGFHVLPIYGGQPYGAQLSGLRRGVHVVVGTPGRIIDHLERGSLDLSQLTTLVLDEADEMLRMGFIDDVETVLKKTPKTRQIALFSATMPAPIKRIAQTYLRDPVEIAIKNKTTTAANIRQRYWLVSGMQKLDALTRILEAEPFDAMIIFARTKLGTEELAERLQARGFSAAAINGDLIQAQRERTIGQLKDGKLDILVATDVAARGLDVERISHVLNYDIPNDTESYVHRIGRTGRAGRQGDAILFVAPRERNMLRSIERATRQPIEAMTLPSADTVNDRRVAKFKDRIGVALGAAGLSVFRDVIEQYEREHNVPAIEIAAALARLAQGDKPLLLDAAPKREFASNDKYSGDRSSSDRQSADRYPQKTFAARDEPRSLAARPDKRAEFSKAPRSAAESPFAKPARKSRDESFKPAQAFDPSAISSPGEYQTQTARESISPLDRERVPARSSTRASRDSKPQSSEPGMETFRVEVGHAHGVKPGNIVGAIANEAGLDAKHIGRISIQDDYSLIDLPEGMPPELLSHLKKVWVAGQRLRISHNTGDAPPREADDDAPAPRGGKFKPGGKKPFKRS